MLRRVLMTVEMSIAMISLTVVMLITAGIFERRGTQQP